MTRTSMDQNYEFQLDAQREKIDELSGKFAAELAALTEKFETQLSELADAIDNIAEEAWAVPQEAENLLLEVVDDMPDDEASIEDWKAWGRDLQARTRDFLAADEVAAEEGAANAAA